MWNLLLEFIFVTSWIKIFLSVTFKEVQKMNTSDEAILFFFARKCNKELSESHKLVIYATNPQFKPNYQFKYIKSTISAPIHRF